MCEARVAAEAIGKGIPHNPKSRIAASQHVHGWVFCGAAMRHNIIIAFATYGIPKKQKKAA